MQIKINKKQVFIFYILMIIITDISIIFDIYFYRQILSFIFLMFLPGLLLIQVLKLNRLNNTSKFVLCIGLSTSSLMFSGFLSNYLYQYLGILNPISIFPLLFIMNILLIVALIIEYNLNSVSTETTCNLIRTKELLNPALLLFLVFLLSVTGSLAIQYYHNTTFSLIFTALVALIVVLATLDKIIPERLYSLCIFVFSFSLLINRTLTSPYLFGSDIHYEYYIAQLVRNNSYWDFSVGGSNLNSMLSVTMLPSILSIFMKVDPIWIYKIVYSFTFSVVPLSLYEIYTSQIKSKEAFLSAFFFMSFYAFFKVMPWLPRQQIAELYVVLIVFVLINKDIELIKKRILNMLFIASLIVSHYGITYIFLFCLTIAYLGSVLIRTKNKISMLSSTTLLLSYLIALFWYIYLSNSNVFSAIVNLGNHIYASVIIDLFSSAAIDPDIAVAFGVGIMDRSTLHALGHFWGIITEVLIFVGLFYSIFKYKDSNLSKEYILFSVVCMILISLCIVLPYFASSLLMYRIYQYTLIFLSPFCIIGAEKIINLLLNIFKSMSINPRLTSSKRLLLVVLIPYFLFNSGVIYELVENPSNYNFNINNEQLDFIPYSSYSYFVTSPVPTQDVLASRWSSKKIYDYVFVDELRRCEVTGYGLIRSTKELNPRVPSGNYIFLGYQNLKEGTVRILDPNQVHKAIDYNITEIEPSLYERNKIYTNNGAEFYM